MISIFTDNPAVSFQGIEDDPQLDVAYHFDAILRYTVDQRSIYTSYPIEFGADVQDHAYNSPDKMLLYGVTGSQELRFSVNQLPAIGAAAVVGAINDPVVSTVAGFLADVGYLAGNNQTRGGSTLNFLRLLKQRFATFTVVTDLLSIPNVKVDRIINEVNTQNETGLEFIVELSQLRVTGDEANPGNLIPNLPDEDPAKTMASALLDRGRIALG